MKAQVSAFGKGDTEKKDVSSLKNIKTDLSAMQNEMKMLFETVQNKRQERNLGSVKVVNLLTIVDIAFSVEN